MTVRNYGLDLLRIISIWMVVALHVVNLGGILHNTVPSSVQYHIAWTINMLCYCAIHCFALISGYVGINNKFKLKRIIEIWVQVVFWCLTITLFCWTILKVDIGIKEWIKAVMPVMFQQYWYVTAYFCLFFFMPCLNCIVKNLERKYMKMALFMSVVLFSVLQTIRQVDVFGTGYGFSFLWLAILYVFGAYIKQYDIHIKSVKAFGGYILCCLLALAFKMGVEFCPPFVKTVFQDGTIVITYTSPLVLFSGIFLFLCFESMKIHINASKIIQVIAPTSFGIYIIHTHPLVLENILKNSFVNLISCNAVLFLLSILGFSLGIWGCCFLIEKCRICLFKMAKVQKGIEAIESVLIKFWCGIRKLTSYS